jgi:dihydroneopterin aldolase
VATRPEDRITLKGVRLNPRIGVTPGERRFPQLCRADITIWGDFESAASTDSLDKALDYTKLLQKALETARAEEFNLLETLAYRLARSILSSFPAQRVNVRIRKHPASLVEQLDFIEVEVEES